MIFGGVSAILNVNKKEVTEDSYALACTDLAVLLVFVVMAFMVTKMNMGANSKFKKMIEMLTPTKVKSAKTVARVVFMAAVVFSLAYSSLVVEKKINSDLSVAKGSMMYEMSVSQMAISCAALVAFLFLGSRA